MKITRRHVLATSAALAVAGGVGVGATAWRWWDRPAEMGRLVLSSDEYAFAQALAEAWMPRGGEPALSGADADVGAFLDETVAALAPTNRKLLKLLMQILDDLPLPTRLSAYRHLPLEARQEILRGWMHHDQALLRAAIQGLLMLLSIGWTTHPEVAAILQPSMRCRYGR